MSRLDPKQLREMFGIQNENAKPFFAMIPRCVILDKSLSPNAFRLYCLLIARANEDQITWVSQTTLGEHLGLKKLAIVRSMKILKENGLIQVKKVTCAQGFRNVYLIVDVEKIYGPEIRAPWKKTEFIEKNGRVVSEKIPGVVSEKIPGVVSEKIPKVEEGDAKEIKTTTVDLSTGQCTDDDAEEVLAHYERSFGKPGKKKSADFKKEFTESSSCKEEFIKLIDEFSQCIFLKPTTHSPMRLFHAKQLFAQRRAIRAGIVDDIRKGSFDRRMAINKVIETDKQLKKWFNGDRASIEDAVYGMLHYC